ncbi:MAG: hypothetical protein KDC95_03450 [Planctomycetes bacterium]|nr:hypothetical protein [Planctomycetota bacterium]
MKLLPILILASLSSTLGAQAVVELRFTEVLIDPVGSNAGQQVLEYENTGNVDIDTTGWFLAVGTTTTALPPVMIRTRVIGRIHLGKSGASSGADLYVPTAPTLTRSDSIALFKNSNFNDPAALVDFVSWGGGQGFIALATRASQWKTTLETVAVPSSEGHTIAHYGVDTWGRYHAAEDWYQDATPTLGLPNDPGSMFGHLRGCPNMTGAPGMGLLNEKSRAWLGEIWEADLYNLPPGRNTAIVFLGFRPLTPIPLDAIGLVGCGLNIDIAATTFVPVDQGSGLLTTRIPATQSLIGIVFYLQGMLFDISYSNPANAAMTNSLVIKIGSR